MSAPRIEVKRSILKPLTRYAFHWRCTADENRRMASCGYGWQPTVAAAADAGREHLRQAHPEVVWAAGGNVYQATQRTYETSRRDA